MICAKLEGNAEIVIPDVVLDAIEDDPTITGCWNALSKGARTI
jgi:uncharacterized protein YdeI (YjbR/CyaY-like superfamily)